MKQIKIYKTVTIYPNGKVVKRNFTEEALKEMIKCVGYQKEPFCELYIAETDAGFNFLEIESIELIINEW